MKNLLSIGVTRHIGLTLALNLVGMVWTSFAVSKYPTICAECLLEKKITITITDATVYDLVGLLRREYKIPISFIDSGEREKITLDYKDASLKNVLENVMSQAPSYRFKTIDERLLIYNNLPKYSLISDITIKNEKRFFATLYYLQELKKQFSEFSNLITFPPLIMADIDAPVYSDVVSVKGKNIILEHFVQLLGLNPRVYFTITTVNQRLVFDLADVDLSDYEKNISVSKFLLEKKTTITITDATVYDLVELLRREYKIPISFIDSGEREKITLDLKDVSLKTVLENVISKAPSYRFKTNNGKLILYNNQTRYNRIINVSDAFGIERVRATQHYISQLRQKYAEFENLKFIPNLIGTNLSIYSQIVYLRGRRTILEHLLQLVESNPRVVFSILKTITGQEELSFEEVSDE